MYAIKLCVQLGKTSTDTFEIIKNASNYDVKYLRSIRSLKTVV